MPMLRGTVMMTDGGNRAKVPRCGYPTRQWVGARRLHAHGTREKWFLRSTGCPPGLKYATVSIMFKPSGKTV